MTLLCSIQVNIKIDTSKLAVQIPPVHVLNTYDPKMCRTFEVKLSGHIVLNSVTLQIPNGRGHVLLYWKI